MRLRMLVLLLAFFLFVVFGTSAYANLIDLTPGGFNTANGIPSAFQLTITQIFFDEAAFGTFNLPTGPMFFDGWLSMFGSLNGGQFFFTDLFQNSPTTAALVWWNFNGEPHGDWLTAILVEGSTPNGTVLDNIYGVPSSDRFVSPSNQTVTVDGNAQIFGISFYGLNPAAVPAPEADTLSLLLPGLATVAVFGLCRRRWRQAG